MAENVASTALRGLSNALELSGDRTGPPGIELGIPSQPVEDLTQYARYGSAHVFHQLSDGWLTLIVKDVVIAAAYESTTVEDWSSGVSGDFGISSGRLSRMALWIYGVSLRVNAAVALADVGASALYIRIPSPIRVGGAGVTEYMIFGCDGTAPNRIETAPLEVRMVNQVRPFWPFQWAAGQAGVFRNQNVNANSVSWEWVVLCRMLPMGQAPLP